MKKSVGRVIGVLCGAGVLVVLLTIVEFTNGRFNVRNAHSVSLLLDTYSGHSSNLQRTLKSVPLERRDINGSLGEDTDDVECRDFHQLNTTDGKCWFIRNTSDCDSDDGFINYLEFVYCDFSSHLVPLAFVILFVWLIFLFVALGTTAEDYFCPALTVISHTLKLSQNIAGVTFLAFGNGAPDIFSAIAAITGAKNGDAGLAIGALFGAGIFVTTVVVGAIALAKPFKAAERPFLRDCIFYLGAAYWTFVILRHGEISTGEAIGFIGLYVFYVIVVLVGRKIYQYQKKKQKEAEESANPSAEIDNEPNYNIKATNAAVLTDSTEIHPDVYTTGYGSAGSTNAKVANRNTANPDRAVKGVLNVTEQVTVAPLLGVLSSQSPAFRPQTSIDDSLRSSSGEFLPLLGRVDSRPPPSQWFAFLLALVPVDYAGWKQKAWYSKCYEIFKAPLQFVLQLTVPVVDYDEDKHQWNRILNSLHIITGSLFSVFVTKVALKSVSGGFLVWHLVLIISFVLALVVFFTSKHEKQPIYHPVFAYLGFVVAVLWIYSIANEIVNILEMFGIQFNISNAVLGLTLLAWGNSIGDLIADTTMAKQGFPNMGMSACFGGPLFNMLLGIGISCTIATIENGGSFLLTSNVIQIVLALGLAVSLLSSMLIMLITKFHVTRPYGVYLVALYVVFLVGALLIELGVINL
ncbi:mitochondrial sodium/calcium exchanger protein-like [Glandiceps talaboti]